MNTEKLKGYAPLAIRIGLGLVMLWFGSQQLMDAKDWVGYLPSWMGAFSVSSVTIVHLNGWFEVAFGSLLILGFYARFVALLLALHLFGITMTVGYNEIGVRDFGLSFALLSAAFSGAGKLSLDSYFSKTESVSNL